MTVQQIIDSACEQFDERFSRTNIQTNKKENKWFFSETLRPKDVHPFLISSIKKAVEVAYKDFGTLREVLSEIEHEQWIAWSKNIAESENITPARLERWQKLWCPYSELTEAQKDQDREWADKIISLIEKKKSLFLHECCDGECNHDDCCGKVPANCPLKDNK